MRRFASGIAVASLLGCSLAFAQTASPPGGAGTQAAPPPTQTAPPSSNYGSTPSGESTHEHATAGKHMSRRACAKQAKTKQLKGTERKQFIKDCEAGKSTE